MANLNLNKVILGGRLTTDIELKQTQSGTPVCSFSIAVNRRRTAEGKQETDFINCVAWRHNADFISNYFRKGSSICITGQIQTRSWEQDGQKRYTTEVIVDEAYFVDSKSESAQPTNEAQPFANPQAVAFEVGDDEDLPF